MANLSLNFNLSGDLVFISQNILSKVCLSNIISDIAWGTFAVGVL